MPSNTVSFTLTEAFLKPLFPFVPAGITIEELVQLCLNQTLLRDGFYGAWAQVYWDSSGDGNVDFVITSPDPNADVTGYATVYPNWLNAVSVAVAAYNGAMPNPPPPAPPATNCAAFLPPFGLAMLNTKSVQLLHYPPTETLSYMDYLYSPTNRRWESLLLLNGSNGYQNQLLETITDLVPIAANGGSAGTTAIEPWFVDQKHQIIKDVFTAYVPQMLNVFLRPRPDGKATQPVIGYGGPVMDWLQGTYKPTDISPVVKVTPGALQPMSLFLQQFIAGGPPTPVLCANHPSKFMYYNPAFPGGNDPSSKYPPTDFTLVLQQDLTAALWQIQMTATPDADPVATLASAWDYWTSPAQQDLFNQIMQEQITEFVRPVPPSITSI